MGDLSSKVAIVTGASQAFAEAGRAVTCAARNVDSRKETVAQIEKVGGRPLVRLVTHAERVTGQTIRVNSLGVGEIVETIGGKPFDVQ